MHCLCQNACMTDNSKDDLQITVRGLDSTTKQALVKKAAQKGVSLNQYALAALKQSAGIETSQERYKRFKQFLSKSRVSDEDKRAVNEAIAWMDKTSIAKQKRDEGELGI